MDQRFSIFLLEKYRLELQQEARAFHEEEINSKKVYRPNRAAQSLVTSIARFITSTRKPDKKGDILIHLQKTAE